VFTVLVDTVHLLEYENHYTFCGVIYRCLMLVTMATPEATKSDPNIGIRSGRKTVKPLFVLYAGGENRWTVSMAEGAAGR
jgi:hypothetical protein